MQFDWYSATVGAGPDEVLGVLGGFGQLEPIRGLHSYAQGMEVRQGTEVVARAFWGGVNGTDSVHVQASGEATPDVVNVVRGEWPSHRVSRADACRDFSDAKAWRRLSKLAISVAADHRVKTATNGDWIGKQDGRTLYLGGPSARVRARVYEKGKQLGPLADQNRVRVECQVRPQGADGKEALCCVPPERLWWSSQWSADFAERLGVPELEAIAIRPAPSVANEERTRYWLAVQYGAVLGRWGDEIGWANLPAAVDELRQRARRGS